jgi:hypothetical protein
MNAQCNRTGVDLSKHNTVAMSSLVGSDTIHKSVLGATVDGLSRQRGNRPLQWVRSLHQCSLSITARSQWSDGEISGHNYCSNHSGALV